MNRTFRTGLLSVLALETLGIVLLSVALFVLLFVAAGVVVMLFTEVNQ